MTITFVADAVEVRLALENRGDRSIDELWYPVWGGVTGVSKREETQETINFAGGATNIRRFADGWLLLGMSPRPAVKLFFISAR